MKLTVVSCDCRNPAPHVKLQDERGYKSDGIFSLASGRHFIGKLKDGGHMTDAEYAATDAELVAANLPEFPSFTDERIDRVAFDLIANCDEADTDRGITQAVSEGDISPADAERLRAAIREMKLDPTKAVALLAEQLRAEMSQAASARR